METRSKVVMARVYIVFFILSALVAFLLFTYLPGSEASAEGGMGGLNFKTGGAFAGFIISFWVLHWAYFKVIFPKQRLLRGNTIDEQGRYVEGADIAVDGLPLGKQKTRENGVFEIQVDDQAQWTIRATKGQLSAIVTVQAKQLGSPIRLELKKKRN